MYSATPARGASRRTKPQGRHPDKRLTTGFVRTAAPGRYCDGQGLYLYVQTSGARSWVQRLVIHGRRRDLGLGSVALVSLAEAREKARANRKLAREGGDPLAEKRRAEKMPTFAEARPPRAGTEAGWLAQRQAPAELVDESGALRLSPDRRTAGFRGDERRGAGSSHADLAREGADGAAGVRADPCGTGVGRGGGAAQRQPLRPDRAGPRSAAGDR